MKCNKCNIDCIIDEWNGWIWVCPICGKEYRKATDKEINKLK